MSPTFIAINAGSGGGRPMSAQSTLSLMPRTLVASAVSLAARAPHHLLTPEPTPHGPRVRVADTPLPAEADSSVDDTLMPDADVSESPNNSTASSLAMPVSCARKGKRPSNNLAYCGMNMQTYLGFFRL
jgi:hypothetical protein